MTPKNQYQLAAYSQNQTGSSQTPLDQMWTLAETTSAAVLMFRNGVCSNQNQMAEQIFGYSQEEAFGQSIDQWVASQDRALVEGVLSGPEGCWVNEITALRKDSSTFSAGIRVCAIQHAGQEVKVFNFYDLSNQRLATTLVQEQELYSHCLNDVVQVLHSFTKNVPFQEFLGTIGLATKSSEAMIALGSCQSLKIVARWNKKESHLDKSVQKDRPEEFELPPSKWTKLEESCLEAYDGEIFQAMLDYLPEGENREPVLLVPVKSINGLIGILGLYVCDVNKKWEIHEKEFLRAAANHLAHALEWNQKEHKILASLEEKDVLLREIHHRVKNNMQLISSLLSLQARRIGTPEVAAAIDESQNRIHSMSLIHEMLYQSTDLSAINAGNYFNRLVGYLANIYRQGDDTISWQVKSDEIVLAIDDAIPVGLIVNELVTNAFEHGFKGLPQGVLKVLLRRTEAGSLELIVEDDGHGIPTGKKFENAKTMGMQMVNDLAVSQLDGELSINRAKGTCVHFHFTPTNCDKVEY